MQRGAPLGNKNGSKNRPWADALKRALARSGKTVDGGLNAIADQVVSLAMEGDKDAWQEIANRMDGKPVQALVGEDGPLIPDSITIRLVRPDCKVDS